MEYTCEVVKVDAQPVVSIRSRSASWDLQKFFGKAYGEIFEYLEQIGVQPVGSPFAAYHNSDMEDLDIEAGVPVDKVVKGKGQITSHVIEAGSQLTTHHVGPYSEIEPAYEALMAYAKDNKLVPTGVAYEFYLNNPMETDEEDLQTEIAFPLR